MMMTPASTLAMPRCVPPAVFPTSARAAGDRRSVRFFRPVAACGGENDQPPAVPASLRAIQAKRKLEAARPPRAAECAVAALVRAVGSVQGAAVGGAVGAAWGAGDAVAWVFSKVQFHSPDLAVGLFGMLASVVGAAVEAKAERAKAKQQPDEPAENEEEPKTDDDDGYPKDVAAAKVALKQLYDSDMQKEMWATIGILHGSDDVDGEDKGMLEGLNGKEAHEINCARARRRKAAYERLIAGSDANSLILSNYAQLLYEFYKDMKRAEEYFQQAVVAKPADGEAMRRYAMFLWHVRDDMDGAEDMFNGAIEKEPESSHIRSSYAWFLWMTGGVGTCLIDNDSGDNAE